MDSLDARYYTGRPRPLAIRYGWPAVVHLRIGEQRVKTHVHNLLSKLGVSSRIQVALYSSRARLLDQALDKPA